MIFNHTACIDYILNHLYPILCIAHVVSCEEDFLAMHRMQHISTTPSNLGEELLAENPSNEPLVMVLNAPKAGVYLIIVFQINSKHLLNPAYGNLNWYCTTDPCEFISERLTGCGDSM